MVGKETAFTCVSLGWGTLVFMVYTVAMILSALRHDHGMVLYCQTLGSVRLALFHSRTSPSSCELLAGLSLLPWTVFSSLQRQSLDPQLATFSPSLMSSWWDKIIPLEEEERMDENKERDLWEVDWGGNSSLA